MSDLGHTLSTTGLAGLLRLLLLVVRLLLLWKLQQSVLSGAGLVERACQLMKKLWQSHLRSLGLGLRRQLCLRLGSRILQ